MIDATKYAPDDLECCPEHPTALVRREWDRTQYFWGHGEPAGRPIDRHIGYWCNECNRPLKRHTALAEAHS